MSFLGFDEDISFFSMDLRVFSGDPEEKMRSSALLLECPLAVSSSDRLTQLSVH